METISIGYDWKQIAKTERYMKKMISSIKRPSGRRKYSDGLRDAFILIFRCTHGQDFTFVGLKRLEEEFGVHPRTIERWLKTLIEDGWIARGVKCIDGYMRCGFYLLAHPLLLNLLEKLNLPWRKHNEEQEADQIKAGGPESEISDGSGEPDHEKNGSVRKIDEYRAAHACSEEDRNSSCAAGHGESLGKEGRPSFGRHNRRLPGAGVHGGIRVFRGPKDNSAPRRRCATYANLQADLARQVVGNLPDRLTIRNGFNVPPFPPEKNLAASSPSAASAPGENGKIFIEPEVSAEAPAAALFEIPQDTAWTEAKNTICASSPHLRPLLDQLASRRLADGTLSLDGPADPVTNIIERQYGRRIAEALRQVGVDRHQYGVWPPELRQQIEARDQARADRERIREERQRQQAVAARAIRLAQMTPAQQFEQLEAAYPAGKSGWWAKQVFLRMHKRGDIPALPVLLSALSRQKDNPSWQRDNARWVPKLNNWLIQRQWREK
ncbi:hypothetical protein [Desulfobulbus elongatus]|uniref:hypothetical protein n=1 Tax=Desulfobulbus elongatus TaxID=53332 RepID=UPI000A9AEB45|nr:hypothetical protein [Desulfobulbus elongatus]